MKNLFSSFWLLVIALAAPHLLCAQIITTIAGNGIATYTHDGVAATATGLNYPPGVTVDTSGNIYIADQDNNAVRKIDMAGNIYTVAGTGASGYTGDLGAATSATLNHPTNVNADRHGNLYISDEFNNVVRKVNAAGIITTVAGNGSPSYSGNGFAATAAGLWYPYRTIVDTSGNLYIADQNNHVVRKVDTAGIITTVAGTGTAGYTATGPATAANLQAPEGLALDTAGNLFIADANDHVVFKVNTAGIISVFAGRDISGYSGDGSPATAALFSYPSQVIFDKAGNLYISDFFDNVVRKIDAAGIIHTIAGNDTMGFSGDGGPATNCKMNGPDGMAFDLSGNLLIADCSNYRIRKLTIPAVTTTNTALTTAQPFELSLFPNPNTGSFRLCGQLKATTANLSVSDLFGNIVYCNSLVAHGGQVDEPIILGKGLSNGLYLLRINAAGQEDDLRFEVRR